MSFHSVPIRLLFSVLELISFLLEWKLGPDNRTWPIVRCNSVSVLRGTLFNVDLIILARLAACTPHITASLEGEASKASTMTEISSTLLKTTPAFWARIWSAISSAERSTMLHDLNHNVPWAFNYLKAVFNSPCGFSHAPRCLPRASAWQESVAIQQSFQHWVAMRIVPQCHEKVLVDSVLFCLSLHH
jgi:hypothetical protein